MPDFQKIEEAVAGAAELPISAREDWLEEFCGRDDDLRREASSLLKYQPEVESFLEKSVNSYAAIILSAEETELAGKKFGNYQIIREIGRGGMGAVFLAERSDGAFDQQIALKIVRETLIDKDLEWRFVRERQILANLNHPNIAKLLDGGVSATGEPFLAMEHIEGKTLLDFAEKRELSLNERLRLFLKICNAVSYAHRNLIIHRDIKPSNIIVDNSGEPKLLDFGLAKIVDVTTPDTDQTQTAFRALTPAYASPEQLCGETVTTASDIYSLGVVLYELLTNGRPFHFKGKSLDEIIKTVTSFEPLPPSLNSRSAIRKSQLKGDLDNIALMALRKEPVRRYQSVEALANDIERHLKGLPVSAQANTRKYRISKFVKRHRAGVFAAAMIFLSLIGGVVISLWQTRRAEMQKVRAEKRFGEVRKLSNSLMFEIHDSVQDLQGSTPTRQLIVSRALEYFDSLAQESGDDPGLQIDLATAYQKIGDIQGNPYSANLGDTPGALKSYQKSVSILESLTNLQTTTESQISLGKSYRAVGDVMEVEGNVFECVNNYRRSLEIFENLSSQQADNTEVKDELARAYETLGDGMSRMENFEDEKLQNYRRNLAIREDLADQNPTERKFRRSLALAYLKVGGAFDAKQPEAVENLKKCISILEDLSKTDPTNARARREVGFAYYQLGNILTQAQNFPEALESRRKAFVIRQEFAINDLQNKQAQFDLGTAYADLSEALTNTEDTTQALVNARQSQEIMERLSREDVSNAIYRRNVGMSYEKSAFAYEHDAKNEKLNIADRLRKMKESSEWYKKTEQIFATLKVRNELQPRDVAQIDRLNKKISDCENLIAKLSTQVR